MVWYIHVSSMFLTMKCDLTCTSSSLVFAVGFHVGSGCLQAGTGENLSNVPIFYEHIHTHSTVIHVQREKKLQIEHSQKFKPELSV